jgi:hypothetical protein
LVSSRLSPLLVPVDRLARDGSSFTAKGTAGLGVVTGASVGVAEVELGGGTNAEAAAMTTDSSCLASLEGITMLLVAR